MALKAVLLVLLILMLGVQARGEDLARYVYPLAPQRTTPPVVIDVSDFPEGKAWAEAAKALVEEWYPLVTAMLATEDFRPPQEIKLIIKREIGPPAFASGGAITINGQWITRNPHDLGMVIHELVHVVQAYPRNRHNTGWLVEGIADYIRWWRYEPESITAGARPRIDPAKH
jgi:hypothetical protein